jgi:hypothetical protein
MWRAYQNLLPTKDNLLRRKIVKDPFCPIYERDAETVLHALWWCLVVEDVWRASKSIFHKCSSLGPGFMHVVEKIMQKSGTK